MTRIAALTAIALALSVSPVLAAEQSSSSSRSSTSMSQRSSATSQTAAALPAQAIPGSQYIGQSLTTDGGVPIGTVRYVLADSSRGVDFALVEPVAAIDVGEPEYLAIPWQIINFGNGTIDSSHNILANGPRYSFDEFGVLTVPDQVASIWNYYDVPGQMPDGTERLSYVVAGGNDVRQAPGALLAGRGGRILLDPQVGELAPPLDTNSGEQYGSPAETLNPPAAPER